MFKIKKSKKSRKQTENLLLSHIHQTGRKKSQKKRIKIFINDVQ